jgi:hypothetical protein
LIGAVLTVLLLRETRRMRQAQTDPKIDISYEVREEFIAHVDIVVRNIGLGGGYDLRFEAEPVTADDETRTLLAELFKINFVRSGMRYLSPGQQARSFFTNVSEDYRRKLNSAFKVVVRYRNDQGREFSDEYCIDFSELIGLRRVGEPPLHKMAKSLEALQDDVHALAGGSPRSRRTTRA